MTVKELIKQLQQLEEDAEVFTIDDEYQGIDEIKDITIELIHKQNNYLVGSCSGENCNYCIEGNKKTVIIY